MKQEKKDSKTLNLIKKSVAPTATETELETFLYLCHEYNLDPLKKEIFFIKYNNKATILTSRDGYLKIANLNKQFDGLESDVVYSGDRLTKRDDGSIHIEYGESHVHFACGEHHATCQIVRISSPSKL